MKKRSTLKLLMELFFVGVVEDSAIFNNIIKDLTSIEHLRDRDTTLTNLTLLASFARQGRILLGLPPTAQDHEEVNNFFSISTHPQHCSVFTQLLYLFLVIFPTILTEWCFSRWCWLQLTMWLYCWFFYSCFPYGLWNLSFSRSCFTLDSLGSILFQFFKSLNITADQKKFFRKAFHTYYDAAAELLQSEHTVRDSLSSLEPVIWSIIYSHIPFCFPLSIQSLGHVLVVYY